MDRPAVKLPTPSEVCAFVDELDSNEVGELRVHHGESVAGAVFVQGNRVCWVAAAGLARTLSQLLVARAGIAAEAMERHFERCRDARIPVGEDLVARGVIGPNALRSALFDHSTASLSVLCREGARGEWRPRERSYSARFTFPTSELLARTYAIERNELAERASHALADLFDANEGDWAAAFVRVPGRAHPVPFALFGAFPDRATELAYHAKWATSCLDITATFAGARASVLTTTPGPEPRVHCALHEASYFVVGETCESGARRVAARRLALVSFAREAATWKP